MTHGLACFEAGEKWAGGGLFFWALAFVFGAKVSKKSKGDTDGSGVKLTAAVKKKKKKSSPV